jgi:alkylation response protein AidB-like acyl-CoA dehydrogenase
MTAVIEELTKAHSGLASLYIHTACYLGILIGACDSERQKRNLLPKIAEGTLMFAYGLSEPDIGADLASVKTRAELSGETVVNHRRQEMVFGRGRSRLHHRLGSQCPQRWKV